jgi:phosphate starvation-inducible protein PhoH
MFDEMTYREMEFALKEVIEAENNRLSSLREILLGTAKASTLDRKNKGEIIAGLNSSQQHALEMVSQAADVAFIHGPPGTG